MKKGYINARIYTGREVLKDHVLLTNDGWIEKVYKGKVPEGYQIADLTGMNIAPSFIDLQIYGGDGKMFSSELTVDSLRATYNYCRRGGAGHFMITMATNTIDKFLRGIETVQAYWDQSGLGLLGLHLEGPYLNPEKKGAHLAAHIKKPVLSEVEMLMEKGRGVIKMMTIAPEMCDDSIVELLKKNNIIISAGHTNASYEEGLSAFNKGIPAATHLFNAMSPLMHREPGMVGAIMDHQKVMSSIVNDGIHVNYAAVRISKKVMKERLFFITDAVAEVLQGEYQHIYKGDRYTLPDGTLSGSSLTMMQAIKNAVTYADIELDEALRMASTYPARVLGADCKLGLIEEGMKDALVIFDDEFNLLE